jgi:hypothetical protein
MDAARAGAMARNRDAVLQARRTIIGDAFMGFADIPDFAVWIRRHREDPEADRGVAEVGREIIGNRWPATR